MIKITNLKKSFGKKEVLNTINFTFDNKTYGILGPNGAGKTTLLRCITQIYNTKESNISILNSAKIGYLPQKFGMFKELTVEEALNLFGILKQIDKNHITKKINDALELVNLSEQKNNKIKTLSGGMIRRLGVAQAILDNPEIIIFDEPTAGLDPEERLRFKNIILSLKQGRLIIISTHIVEDVKMLCDEIVIMKDGKFERTGSVENITQLANGHCYILPKEKIELISGKYIVQSEFKNQTGSYVKIISPEEQQFEKCQCDLEDGYIWVLKFT